MFRKLHGSRWGVLTGVAAIALIAATVVVAGTGPSALAVVLGVLATLVGVAAIGFLIAWIVRSDMEMTPRTQIPPSKPTMPRRPRPPHGRDLRGRH
jgi:hypothetical protein